MAKAGYIASYSHSERWLTEARRSRQECTRQRTRPYVCHGDLHLGLEAEMRPNDRERRGTCGYVGRTRHTFTPYFSISAPSFHIPRLAEGS